MVSINRMQRGRLLDRMRRGKINLEPEPEPSVVYRFPNPNKYWRLEMVVGSDRERSIRASWMLSSSERFCGKFDGQEIQLRRLRIIIMPSDLGLTYSWFWCDIVYYMCFAKSSTYRRVLRGSVPYSIDWSNLFYAVKEIECEDGNMSCSSPSLTREQRLPDALVK